MWHHGCGQNRKTGTGHISWILKKMLVERSTNLERCGLSQVFLDPLINQTLSLLLLKLLIVVTNICLVFISSIVLLTDRWRVMGQISVAVIAIIPRHRGGKRWRRRRRRREEENLAWLRFLRSWMPPT